MVLSRPSTPKTIDGELSQELDGRQRRCRRMIRVAVLALVGSLAAGIGEATVYEYDRDGRVIVRHFPGVDAERQTGNQTGRDRRGSRPCIGKWPRRLPCVTRAATALEGRASTHSLSCSFSSS